jgi:hypothetical protein
MVFCLTPSGEGGLFTTLFFYDEGINGAIDSTLHNNICQ